MVRMSQIEIMIVERDMTTLYMASGESIPTSDSLQSCIDKINATRKVENPTGMSPWIQVETQSGYMLINGSRIESLETNLSEEFIQTRVQMSSKKTVSGNIDAKSIIESIDKAWEENCIVLIGPTNE